MSRSDHGIPLAVCSCNTVGVQTADVGFVISFDEALVLVQTNSSMFGSVHEAGMHN